MPKFIRNGATENLVYNSECITPWVRLGKSELGLENLVNQGLFATKDELQPHQIALKLQVILLVRAVMSRQYLSGQKGHSRHISSLKPLSETSMRTWSQWNNFSAAVQPPTVYHWAELAIINSPPSRIQPHAGSQCPDDIVCQGQPNSNSLGWVFWTASTHWRIRGFSRPNECILQSLVQTMGCGEEPRNGLEQKSIIRPTTIKWIAMGGDSKVWSHKPSNCTWW